MAWADSPSDGPEATQQSPSPPNPPPDDCVMQCGVTCAANQECSNVGGEGPDASFACVCKANFQDCNAAEEDPSSPDG